jgi:hypothetical protein
MLYHEGDEVKIPQGGILLKGILTTREGQKAPPTAEEEEVFGEVPSGMAKGKTVDTSLNQNNAIFEIFATEYLPPSDRVFKAVCDTDKQTGKKRSKVVVLEFTYDAMSLYKKILNKEGVDHDDLHEHLVRKEKSGQLRKMKTL